VPQREVGRVQDAQEEPAGDEEGDPGPVPGEGRPLVLEPGLAAPASARGIRHGRSDKMSRTSAVTEASAAPPARSSGVRAIGSGSS
jgi:hypothetical protein